MATRTSQASGGFRADDADTWGLGSGVYPATTDDIIIAAGHNITLKEDNEVAYFQQLGGSGSESTLTLASYTLIINSRNSSNSRVIDVGNSYCNIAANTGTIKLAGTADAAHKLFGLQHWADELNNLTIHTSSNNPIYRQEGALTVNGNLTITAGGLTTNTSNHALTVTLQCLVNGGTLTLNGSTVDFGNVEHSSGTINGDTSTIDLNNGDASGYIWEQSGGTWNYDTSTVVCKENGKHLQANAFYNLTVSAPSSANLTHWRDLSGNTMTVHGALLITEGVFRRATVTDTLVVTGDVTVQDGGTLGRTDLSESGPNTFGSLTIADGGTYNATSGTTTLNSGFRDAHAAGTLTLNGGSWAFGGTGGLFEGDLLKNAREVRINQDPVLNFDGTGDYIIKTSESTLPDDDEAWTISFWMKPDAGTTGSPLFWGTVAAGEAMVTYYDSGDSDRIRIGSWGGDIITATRPLIEGSWNHVLFTYPGGSSATLTAYINGIASGTGAATFNITNSILSVGSVSTQGGV